VETDQQLVPSVVSVMVVHEPGDWFDETLDSLADQDYSNLRTVFLLTPSSVSAELTERIKAVLPTAFVCELPDNIGFGPAANEVLRLVEGDNGFFLLCHDDIALDRTAIKTMVAELFRSNAGIVGPKLTEWEHPRMLQHVGLGLDRFGEVDPLVEPGEADQEQHDAVRDVFVLPSACLLTRADLFRSLGGFDPVMSFYGEDVDLCWRAHLTGARVIVVPDARVRHRERLAERRPDLHHRVLQSRHRMRSVAVLTGGSRLLVRSIQLVVLTLVELVIGLFTGRLGEAIASLRALVGLVPRTSSIIGRRRAIRGQRAVPEREVLGLQDRGSSRLTSYLRGKDTATFVGEDSTVRRWREASFAPALAWFVVVAMIIVGSRTIIREGVPAVGEFLAFPQSPTDLWADYRASFDSRGFGATSSNPTGWAVIAIASVFALFRMGLFLTMSVIGLYLLGTIGAWRLATVFPVNRARIAGMVIYVGTPLVPGLLSQGDFSALVWFAALPWLVHNLRRAAGLEAADPRAADSDLTDGVVPLNVRSRVRALAFLSLVLAMTIAFVPVTLLLWAVVGLLLSVSTLLAGSSWRVALWLAGSTIASIVIGLILNLPWAFEWTRENFVAPAAAGATGRPLAEVASLAPNDERFAILAVALYVPILAAVAISRAWRLTWSVRAAVLVFTFGSALIFSERNSLGIDMPASSLLAVPIALGLALGGASIVGGFGSDVQGRGFGWRQPLALIANLTIVVGLVPAVFAIGQGSWHTPRTPISALLAAQLPIDPESGDYRVLYIGDPRVMPIPPHEFADGVAYAVTDAGTLDFTDRFLAPDTRGDDAVERALQLIADGSTLRAGSLLGPLGIRFVVIPKTDGVRSTRENPVEPPIGLLASFQNQLDLGTVFGPPSLDIFVNRAWISTGAQLVGETAAASLLAGEDALTRADLTEAVPSMIGVDSELAGTNEVVAGVLHIAVPFDERILLTVDGVPVEARLGFGVTTAFDVSSPGVGVIGYERDTSRTWWLTSQAVLWVMLLVVAAGARSPFGRRRSADFHDETLIDLREGPDIAPGVAGEVLGLSLSDGPIDDDVELAYGFAEGPFEPVHDTATPKFRGPPVEPVVPKGLPSIEALKAEIESEEIEDEVDLASLVSSVDESPDTEVHQADDDVPDSGGDDR
jgi:GT2 family glycosyltransferase